MRKDLWQQVFLGCETGVRLYSCLNCKAILNISQRKGLRDRQYGCGFEFFDFITGEL